MVINDQSLKIEAGIKLVANGKNLEVWRGTKVVAVIHDDGNAQYDVIRLLNTLSEPPCEECGGFTVVDSGGVHPWGSAIYVPCGSCNK